MSIISRRMQEQIRKQQQETGETVRCFADISLTKELWQKIAKKYDIPENPLENDDGTGLIYWESKNGKVRLLTRGNPNEAKEPIVEITVYVKLEVVEEIGRILSGDKLR